MATTRDEATDVERPGRVRVLGVPIDPLTVDSLHACLLRFVEARGHATVLHVNAHAINLACRYPWFARLLNDADLVFCDGYGVMVGARVLGQRLPARITYADWTWHLAGLCADKGLSLFLVGSRPGVAEEAARRLCDRYPGLSIPGTHHGYFDLRPMSADSARVVAAINAVRPDMVIVGLGMPLQEQWVASHRDSIDAPVVLTGGAVFDYVSGRQRRPPSWMTNHGLEWLGRLILEPRRLMRRYVIGNPLFLWRVLVARLVNVRRAR